MIVTLAYFGVLKALGMFLEKISSLSKKKKTKNYVLFDLQMKIEI